MKNNKNVKLLVALVAIFTFGIGTGCSEGPAADPDVAEKEAAQPVSDNPEEDADQTGEGE